jgi:hypothetical protein
MDREADDGVHHLLSGGVDGKVVGKGRDQVALGLQPMIGDQQRPGPVTRRAGQQAHHHLPLGDEEPLAADEVAFANVAVGGDARIAGVVDGLDHARKALARPTKKFKTENKARES